MARKPPLFQLHRDSAATTTYGPSRDVLEFRPRRFPPLDNTMSVAIFHATTDGGVSVTIDHDDAASLMAWLAVNTHDTWCGSFTHRDSQTTMELVRRVHGRTGDELMDVTIGWTGGGRSRTYVLPPGQAAEIVTFLRRALEEGWAGWLAPQDVSPLFHGHMSMRGVQVPCKLCEFQATKA